MAKKVLEKLQLEVKETLESLGLIEVVSISSKSADMRFLCRVSNESKWLSLLQVVLAEEPDYYLFIGKKYFVTKGKLLYGWVIILESDNLDVATRSFRKKLLSTNEGLPGALEGKPGDTTQPSSYTVPLPFKTGYGKKLQGRVKPLG
jgi:hypothetical protein